MGAAVSLINNSSVAYKHVLHIIVLENNSYHSRTLPMFLMFLRASVGIIHPSNLTTLLSASIV